MRRIYTLVLCVTCAWIITWDVTGEFSQHEKFNKAPSSKNENFIGDTCLTHPSNTNLSVEFLTPQNGAHVRGECHIKISVNSTTNITMIEWGVDGNLMMVFYNNTTEWVWNTTDLRERSYKLCVIVRNAKNEYSSAEINVWVDNTPPLLCINEITFEPSPERPPPGIQKMLVRVNLDLEMADNIAISARVDFFVEGEEEILQLSGFVRQGLKLHFCGRLYTDISTPDGVHNFTVICYDLAGNSASASYQAVIDRNEIYREHPEDYSPYFFPLSLSMNFVLVVIVIWLIFRYRKTKEMLEIERTIQKTKKNSANFKTKP
ncbi:MAG: Ig-like domain-containing protein [Thermoplasmata archaeon]